MNNDQGLARGLKNRHVQMIALGGTIGTGLFLGSGKSIHSAGPAIVLAYLITGIICFWLMQAMGDLLLSDLTKHSFIDFVAKYLGKKVGFVTGWTYWFCWITIAMADLTASGLYLQYWFPNVPRWLPGMVILLLLLAANLTAVGLFGETEFWFALIKIAAIVGLIITGVVLVMIGFKTQHATASVMNLFNYGGFFATGIAGFVKAFQMVTFGFIGIELIGVTASETQKPQMTIPKAINEIPLRVILFYVGSMLALICIYPWNQIPADQSPFVQVFKLIGVPAAAGIINFVVLTAAASACNSSIFSTSRMLFSLSRGRQSSLAKKLSHLSRRQVPANSILFSTAVIGIVVIANFVFPNTILFSFIASVATTCFLFIWAMIICAHLKCCKQTKLPFKKSRRPITDYLVLGFLLFVAWVMCLDKMTLIALLAAVIWLLVLWLLSSVTIQAG
ncbi:amino acid permease [Liquorilactobacillus vini]|uniref:APC family amino acid transporter n=1 Tax=Liquorilactobacillus vini DSM 20605 TaxID=1133569 RepID=A0A0R2CFS3_9LACO|nr:amino acid permease [Liquorilactobacillus vini]KRM87020.1 APC family amino acid transporter [Liquorilactobacillus vini DSM 20605]